MSDEAGAVGMLLGPYRIASVLGEGAMGDVYLAVHEALGRRVAIKTLKPAIAADRAMTERFFAEARAVNIIHHENIVECTDLVNDPAGKSYIVMELLEGRTLGAAIRAARRLPARRAVRIAAQIADALGAAHDKGIVHRDLKPENVFLIKRAGSPDYVKVLDFGMARLRPDLGAGVAATQSGALIGTPAYMSPEQARGEKAGPAADVYALGAVLFHMLTGQMPFLASSLSLMLVAVLQETPQRTDRVVPDVPQPLADVVERALAKDPARRPADMATFRRELLTAVGLPTSASALLVDAAASAESSAALDATLDPNAAVWAAQTSLSAAAGQMPARPRNAGRRRLWIAGGALAIAGAAIAAVITLGSSSDSNDAATTREAPRPTQTNPPPTPPTVIAPPPARVEIAPEPVAPAAPPPPAPAPATVTPPPPPTPKPTIAHDHKPRPPAPARHDAAQAEPAKTAPEPAEPAKTPEPAKVDRTKQLVGPKPPPAPK